MWKVGNIIKLAVVLCAIPLLCSFRWPWQTEEKKVPSEITGLDLEGRIEKGNLVFDLNVKIKAGNDCEPVEE